MKRFIMKLGLATAVVLMAGQAYAGGNKGVAVSAAVVGTCQFNAGAASLAFGNLDPLIGGAVVGVNTPATFWCTKNAAVLALTDDGGVNGGAIGSGAVKNMVGATYTEIIPYTMTYTPASLTGAGKSTPINLDFSGSVAEAAYIDASVDTYSDTVTITITP